MKKNFNRLFLISIILLTIISCKKKTETTLINENFRASKIVCLTSPADELLFKLNAHEKIAALSELCTYKNSEEIKTFNIPSIIYTNDDDAVHKIMKYKPDLVTGTESLHSKIKEKLNNKNIPVYLSSAVTLEEIINEINLFGSITDHKEESSALINEINIKLDSLKKTASTEPKRVYWEFYDDPYVSAGKTSYINTLIELAEGINIFNNLNDEYPVVDENEIISRNPDIIFIPEDDESKIDLIKTRPGWNKINAVKTNQIYFIKIESFINPGPGIAESAEYFSSLIK